MQEVVVITGASAGIGRATAMAFAEHGAKVGLIARGIKGLESTKRDIEEAGGQSVIATADVGDAELLENAAEQIEKSLGPVDIWINNAMTTVFGEFKDVTPAEFRRVTEVTYLGFVYGTQCALKRMTQRNRGTIVQVGSSLAFRSIPLQSAYCGAKHAINGFTESIRCELLHQKSKVRITEVHLPAVNTPQFNWCKNSMSRKTRPVPPIFQPELMADYIYWAAHHKRRELLLGTNSLLAVWGNRFFPSLVDSYLAKTGYSSQQYNGPSDPDQPYNLFSPVDTNPGVRGAFSSKAKDSSFQMKLAKVPLSLFAFGITCLVTGMKLLNRKRWNRI